MSAPDTPGRIEGYDLARALACVAMCFVNYKIVMLDPAYGDHAFSTAVGLLEGRAAATFVVLAGCGLSLMSVRARESGDSRLLGASRAILFRRALILFVCGLAYSPLWPADILHFYGVYIAIGAILLDKRGAVLGVASGVLMMGFVFFVILLDYAKGWNWETLAYAGFWTPVGFFRNLFFNGFHPVFPWAAFLLYGMWLARLGIERAQMRRRVIVLGATCWLLTEALSAFLLRQIPADATPDTEEALVALFGTTAMPPMPLYLFAAGGLATAVIGLCLEITARWPRGAVLRPLISTGKLALTFYVAHVVIGMLVLAVFGVLEGQAPGFVFGYTLSFCLIAIALSHLWLKRFARGPFEWMLRRLAG